MKLFADMRRPERTQEEFREHPLTVILTVVFACVCAFGLIYIFAFSDTSEERWQHFYKVFAIAAFFGACLAVAKKREDKAPLSLGIRRAIWASILVAYVVAAIAIFTMGFSPFNRVTDTIRLLCYLGSVAPVPVIAWRLLKTKREANQSITDNDGAAPPRV
jgi:peptidoglycan/LPS O-acetylase OafA/YrhL